MENLQNLKHCPWISDEVSIEDFYSSHKEILQSSFKCHPSKVGWQEACKSFFSTHVSSENLDDDDQMEGCASLSAKEKLWDLQQMEQDCSIDLLTVPNELPASDHLDDANSIATRMPTNWFEGSYNDSVIPEGGAERLLTLHHQQVELHKRTSVGDYGSLRYRTLKYFTTVRLPQEVNTAPLLTDFPEDVIISVRVQRPFFKKLHFKKASNRFPAHSQELQLLGCQLLTDLRGAIECVNDFAVHTDMVQQPDLELLHNHPRAKEEFPSGLFYINGTFYVDLSQPGSKDYSVSLRKWADRLPEIGPLVTREMEHTRLRDLKLRLGYPYLYLHQGYCEHLITFTDVRLREHTDPTDPDRYPLSRGHATKLSVRCISCNRNLAVWVVLNSSLLSAPQSHLCDPCLKLFCYDNRSKPRVNFSLYPFYDEGAVLLEKMRQQARDEELEQNEEEEKDDANDASVSDDGGRGCRRSRRQKRSSGGMSAKRGSGKVEDNRGKGEITPKGDGGSMAAKRGSVGMSPKTGSVEISPKTSRVEMSPKTGSVEMSPKRGSGGAAAKKRGSSGKSAQKSKRGGGIASSGVNAADDQLFETSDNDVTIFRAPGDNCVSNLTQKQTGRKVKRGFEEFDDDFIEEEDMLPDIEGLL